MFSFSFFIDPLIVNDGRNAGGDDQQKGKDGKDNKVDDAHADAADQDDDQAKNETAFQNFAHLMFLLTYRSRLFLSFCYTS